MITEGNAEPETLAGAIGDARLKLEKDAALPLLGIVFAFAFPHFLFDRGWIPHDEGLLAQSAVRVLRGEIPHVDFHDTYTGGQAALHALVFKMLGESIESLRSFHLAIFHLFQLNVFFFFHRLTRSLPLGALALVAMTAWTAPAYPAAMPSWYVAYLGFLVLTILLTSTSSRKWALAGLLIGIAACVKITAAYLLMATLLLVPLLPERERKADHTGSTRLKTALLSLFFVAPVLLLLRRVLATTQLAYLVLPHLFIPFLSLVPWMDRATIIRRISGVLSGLALGILPLALWIAFSHGSVSDWITGIFIRPSVRMQSAAMEGPHAAWLLLTLVLLAIWAGLIKITRSVRAAHWAAIALPALLGPSEILHVATWIVPRLIPGAAAILLMRRLLARREAHDTALISLAIFAAWMSLTQYPYSSGTYQLYCIPFLLPLAIKCGLSVEASWRKTAAAILASLTLFGLVWVSPGNVRTFAARFLPRDADTRSSLERSGIRTRAIEEAYFSSLITFVRGLTPPGTEILAFPDSPEIPFLADRRNPSPVFYDIFSSEEGYLHYLDLAEARGIDTIVVHMTPEFSRRPSEEELRKFVGTFPFAYVFDRHIVFSRHGGLNTARPPAPASNQRTE